MNSLGRCLTREQSRIRAKEFSNAVMRDVPKALIKAAKLIKDEPQLLENQDECLANFDYFLVKFDPIVHKHEEGYRQSLMYFEAPDSETKHFDNSKSFKKRKLNNESKPSVKHLVNAINKSNDDTAIQSPCNNCGKAHKNTKCLFLPNKRQKVNPDAVNPWADSYWGSAVRNVNKDWTSLQGNLYVDISGQNLQQPWSASKNNNSKVCSCKYSALNARLSSLIKPNIVKKTLKELLITSSVS
jgi:hypothetical protein